jgi:hypothetical protein
VEIKIRKKLGNPTRRNFSHVFVPRKLPFLRWQELGNDLMAKGERPAIERAIDALIGTKVPTWLFRWAGDHRDAIATLC